MLRIDRLTKNYGKFPALKGLSLEVPDGALHGFVGPNGAGKTTTMRILATLMPPTSGTAYVDGTDVVLLATYVKAGGSGVTIVPGSGDVNGDGRVDGTDVTLLATYVKAGGQGVVIH